MSAKLAVVVPLGITQTLAWASSYYLLAILAEPIAHDMRMPSTAVFAAFSAALLISAVIGPHVGRTIDRFGGRLVLMFSNVCFALGLALLAAAQSWPLLCLAWLFIGIGMGTGLYDAAFAALVRLYGVAARSPITSITLMAGFASTVGWPLTAWGLDHLGWRETCLGWALAHLLIGIPLNARLPNAEGLPAVDGRPEAPVLALDRTMWLLAFAFAAGWTISTAMAAHLPRLLESAGASPAQALLAGILVGPAQVAARLADALLLQRFHPPAFGARRGGPAPVGGWPARLRSGRGSSVCLVARRRQRNPHHRARLGAPRSLRPCQLWLPPWHSRSAFTHGAGRVSFTVRRSHRRVRRWCVLLFGRAWARRARSSLHD